MQATRPEIQNKVHQTVQETVDKLYKRIENIIQSTKNFISDNPENADQIVNHITNYTQYMHRVIDTIVEAYALYLQEEEPNIKSFQENISRLIARAKNATTKVQSLIS